MRVVVVTTWYPNAASPYSGAFVEKDAVALAAVHDVEVVHLVAPTLHDGGPRTETQHGVRVHRLPMATWNPASIIAASSRLRGHLAGADVVHTAAFSSLLPFALRRPAQPWVHTEHWGGIANPWTLSPRGQKVIAVIGRLLRRPDWVTATCGHMQVGVERFRHERIGIVPCIVPPATTLVERRAASSSLRLVAVGGLVPGKDPLLAVETLAELRRRGTDASLTWVGGGPLRDATLARAEELGVRRHLELTGPLQPDEVPAQLSAHDLFLLPTRAEGFFISGAEAIVHGRPAVVGSVGGMRDYVEDRNGLLVEERTADAYAHGVEKAVAATAGLTAEEIAATIGDRFSAERVVAGYTAAYERAAALRRT